MPIQTPGQVTIERYVYKERFSPQDSGYRYLINAAGTSGYAMLIFRTVAGLAGNTEKKMRKLGLKSQDIVAHLFSFYPNGRALDEETGENMRRGVGTIALNRIIEDALAEGADILFAEAASESVKSFFRKKEFIEIGSSSFMRLWHLE